jgi:ribosomal protein S12 methylthiotransferase
VARYIDMPLQHISDNMLSLMKRETDGAYIRDLIAHPRRHPGIAIRTTFIVGFPGETEADFNELLQFIEDTKFERAGVFNYSREEGTRAAKMEDQIHHMTRKARWNEAMRAIQRSIEGFNVSQVGAKCASSSRTRRRPQRDGRPGHRHHRLCEQEAPRRQFADVTVKEWRGYDLVAA